MTNRQSFGFLILIIVLIALFIGLLTAYHDSPVVSEPTPTRRKK